MLLQELPIKTVRHLRKSVIWTDIGTVIPPAISLHGLKNDIARRTQWLPPPGYLLRKIKAVIVILSGYLRDPTSTTEAPAPPLTKDTSTMTQLRNGLEHRWGERIRVEVPVQVSADQVAGIRGCTRNLSLSGALLRVDANLRLHALIEVSVALRPPSQGAAVILAHVSRQRNEDAGIEWCEFAPAVVKDLLRSPSMR